MTRVFIESELIEAVKKDQEWSNAIEQAKEELSRPYCGYSDVVSVAEDIEAITSIETEVAQDDMYDLYIQIAGGQNESFEEIGSWED